MFVTLSMVSFLNLCNFCGICFLWLLSILSILWLCSFHILRSQRQLTPRKPSVIIFKAILCILGIIVCWPFVIYYGNCENVPKPYEEYWVFIAYFLSHTTTAAPYHVFTFRAYMVYYEINWSNAMMDNQCTYIYFSSSYI